MNPSFVIKWGSSTLNVIHAKVTSMLTNWYSAISINPSHIKVKVNFKAKILYSILLRVIEPLGLFQKKKSHSYLNYCYFKIDTLPPPRWRTPYFPNIYQPPLTAHPAAIHWTSLLLYSSQRRDTFEYGFWKIKRTAHETVKSTTEWMRKQKRIKCHFSVWMYPWTIRRVGVSFFDYYTNCYWRQWILIHLYHQWFLCIH